MKIEDYRRALERLEPEADLEERLRKKVLSRNVSEKAYRVWAAAVLAVCILAAAIVIPALLALRDTGVENSAAAAAQTGTASPEPSRQIVYADTAPGLAMNECVPDNGGIYLAMSMDEEAMLSDPAYADALFSIMIFPYHVQEYYGEAFDGFTLDGWTAETLRARINTLAAECDAIMGECIGKGEEDPPEVEWYDPRDEAQRAPFDPEGKYTWLAEYAGLLPVNLPAQWYEKLDEVLRLEAEEVQLIRARTLYFCEREAERLQAYGVSAEAVSLLDGSLIFMHALLTPEQIRTLPCDEVIGYYIMLAPQDLSEITEMMAMDE